MTLNRKVPLRRTGRVKPVNRKRKQSEFARCYHSKARVAWVKALPCAVSGCPNTPCDNAHVVNAGASRKADYLYVIPLCKTHHIRQHANGWGALGWRWEDATYRTSVAGLYNTEWERYAEGEGSNG